MGKFFSYYGGQVKTLDFIFLRHIPPLNNNEPKNKKKNQNLATRHCLQGDQLAKVGE